MLLGWEPPPGTKDAPRLSDDEVFAEVYDLADSGRLVTTQKMFGHSRPSLCTFYSLGVGCGTPEAT